ncbi:hypothetical protein BMA10399_E0992 [Burkholderia mallei ATCC 10399]|nr:hypothetical protein BMA10399_E0992 [Burkholderia mallei ATCC 10399]
MLLHFGAIGRGPGDARRCPRGAARGRAPMNRTASDSADCAAPFQPTPDAAMHAGSPAVHRSAARHGTARRGNVETRGDDQFIASARFRRSTRAAPVPNARHAARPRCNAPRHSWRARCVAS